MANYTKVLTTLLLICGLVLAVIATGATNEDTTTITKTTATQRQQTQHNHHHRSHVPRHHHHHHHHQQQQQQQLQQHHAHAHKLPRQQRTLEQQSQSLKSDVEMLPGVKWPTMNTKNHTSLRRTHTPRMYYNKPTRSEWDYNTYNIYTNTYGPAVPNAGKGEDNAHDVEFVGASSSGGTQEWPKVVGGRGGYDYVPSPPLSTTAPPPPLSRRAAPTMGTIPPLVPARRGYVTAAPRRSDNDLPNSTDDPFETNTIGRGYPQDAKEMERRHICVQQRTITMPVKTTEVYMRPTWKHVATPCQQPTHSNQMCTRVQMVQERAYRDVIKHKSEQQVTYDCCTGWTRETPHADACMKPICAATCRNGGTCTGPDTCSCPAGFTGRYCEQDINECKEEKPCDQACINTPGSYYCKCREGFVLQADQQSCKKIGSHVDDAFEARDLENDIDAGDEVVARLHKIERSLANEREHTHELQKSLQTTYNVVDTLKSRLINLEKQQLDFSRLQTNLYQTETRTNKLEGMINMLMKCRNGPNAYCP